jgi:hypothetical protein
MDFRITVAVLLWFCLLSIAVFTACNKAEFTPRRWRVISSIFSGIFALALVVWRWRSLCYNGEINVDESQILAQALRYQLDPIPWRSVDGASGGPLYTWALFWAPLVGLKFTYLVARITGLACYLATVIGVSRGLCQVVGRRFGLLLTMPVATLSLTAINFDYVFFSSEQLPMALMAAAFFLLVAQVPLPTVAKAYLIGLMTGALPFCKVQAGPAGVVLWSIGAGICWMYGSEAGNFRRLLMSQILGGLSMPVLILGPVIAVGYWNEFITHYLMGGLSYQNSMAGSSWNPVEHLLNLINSVSEFKVYYLGVMILGAGIFLWGRPRVGRIPKRSWSALLAALLLLGVVSYCVVRSRYPFPHYTLLLVVPVSVLAAIPALFCERTNLEKPVPFGPLLLSLVALAVFFPVQQVFQDYRKQPALLGDWGNGIHPIGEVIKKLTKPGDTFLVWGYAPKFHVFSGVPPSYRCTTTLTMLMEPDMSESSPSVAAYLSDLEKTPPALIIDAPDEFWFPDPAVPKGSIARHFAHPPTRNMVSKGYELIGQMNYAKSPPGMPDKVPIMIYKKKP